MTVMFDRVVITTVGGPVDMTESEFFALPLAERLRAIFEKRLEFWRGDDKVDVLLALQSIRERRPS